MSFTTPRWRDVYVAAAARAIDQGGAILAAVTLQIALQQRGYSGALVAGLLLAAAVPPMLLAPVAGRVVDRFDSRRILVGVGLAQFAVALALAFATALPVILALVAALAAGVAFTSPTFSALTPSMVGREHLARASGIIQSSVTIGMLGGPALGGLLVGAFGTRIPLLIDAVTYLAVPLAGLLIRTRRGGARPVAVPVDSGAGPVWTIWRDPYVRPVVLLFALVVAALTAGDVVEVFLVLGTLHATPAVYGVIGALWMAGMLIGSALTARLRPGDRQSAAVMVLLLATTCLVLLVAGTVPAAGWLLPLWVLGGLCNGGQNVIAGVLIGRRAPAGRRGRAFATFGGLMNAATAVGFAAGGLLMAVTGDARAVMIGTGVTGAVLCLTVGGPLLRRMRARTAVALIG
jgi:MFS family permease